MQTRGKRSIYIMNKKISTKIITVLTVVFSLVAIIGILSRLALRLYLSYKFDVNSTSIKDAGSIGIIGGADGPTAIFLSSKASTP